MSFIDDDDFDPLAALRSQAMVHKEQQQQLGLVVSQKEVQDLGAQVVKHMADDMARRGGQFMEASRTETRVDGGTVITDTMVHFVPDRPQKQDALAQRVVTVQHLTDAKSGIDSLRVQVAPVQVTAAPKQVVAKKAVAAITDGSDWACPVCTFENKGTSAKCEMCESVRPVARRVFAGVQLTEEEEKLQHATFPAVKSLDRDEASRAVYQFFRDDHTENKVLGFNAYTLISLDVPYRMTQYAADRSWVINGTWIVPDGKYETSVDGGISEMLAVARAPYCALVSLWHLNAAWMREHNLPSPWALCSALEMGHKILRPGEMFEADALAVVADYLGVQICIVTDDVTVRRLEPPRFVGADKTAKVLDVRFTSLVERHYVSGTELPAEIVALLKRC
jgi:hypothetical protein